MLQRPRTRPDPALELLDRIQAERRRRAEDRAQRDVAVRGDEIREQCSTLPGFIRWGWPILEPETHYVHGWHIDAICEHLEATLAGEIQNLGINIPPGLMKSLLVSVFFPAYVWGPKKRAGRRFLSSSYEEALALRDNGKMRSLVSSPEYQALWPEVVLTKTGEKKFENTARGSREARAFASMTGGRGDTVLIDDPHSTERAESDKERKKAVRIFRESIQNRVNDARSSNIIVIMQRLHAHDICGVIDELDMGYERLVLPMEFEPKRRCVTKIGFKDPRTSEGELLFPERFPRAEIEKLKTNMGSYAWSGQYQQRPVPREGGLFKRHWFEGKFIREAPKGTKWVRHWDLAATELDANATSGARTAGVKMGRAPDGSYIVGHLVAAGIEGYKVRKLIKATAEADGRSVEISIPQDPGQAAKVQVRELISMLSGWTVRALREGILGDKVTRAEPFSAQCEGGNVFLIEGPWNNEYLDELCQFPGGARKDVADASSGAFSRLVPPRTTKGSGLGAPRIIHAGDDG